MGKYDIPREDQEKWRKIHEELIQGEVDYQPYKVDFSLCENITMKPGEMLALLFLFSDADCGPIFTST
jgi:hypothetical protein